ncbi:response regulator transcription factor [Mobilitalea sibirica]|uniref:Stage 0 sporulation protein A homolog n=1 Tax=Mobilitalea sibirica TaxID=1462919 RepID=A0A8J7H0V8_9FIRM|nr:LytTR family DNA-binding domain-containing protein [Mobilitalea sibirica]MBH1942189.1 response regulator transcription factor [Mobilitalea sibirica]
MRIGICDDEDIIRSEISRLCRKFHELSLIKYDLVEFSSGEELLDYKGTIDILFLDIQMKGMNGMQTAKKIRESDDSIYIIFLTGYRSFMQEGYKVRAFRYLIKPLKEDQFQITFSEVLQDFSKNFKAILGKEGKTYYIKLKDILYIEYANRSSLVRTRHSCYESILTMSEWESLLGTGDFYRVHKAFIVNMQYVEQIDKTILMDNGEKVEVALRKIPKFKKACKEFRKRNAG